MSEVLDAFSTHLLNADCLHPPATLALPAYEGVSKHLTDMGLFISYPESSWSRENGAPTRLAAGQHFVTVPDDIEESCADTRRGILWPAFDDIEPPFHIRDLIAAFRKSYQRCKFHERLIRLLKRVIRADCRQEASSVPSPPLAASSVLYEEDLLRYIASVQMIIEDARRTHMPVIQNL